jgi:hypothetical protein
MQFASWQNYVLATESPWWPRDTGVPFVSLTTFYTVEGRVCALCRCLLRSTFCFPVHILHRRRVTVYVRTVPLLVVYLLYPWPHSTQPKGVCAHCAAACCVVPFVSKFTFYTDEGYRYMCALCHCLLCTFCIPDHILHRRRVPVHVRTVPLLVA